MEDIFYKYTAGELLKWLTDKSINEYCMPQIIEIDDETCTYDVLDIEQIKTDFLQAMRRYYVVKRGKNLYLHDNKIARDIFVWQFDNNTYEETQNIANDTCELLNKNKLKFIGDKH